MTSEGTLQRSSQAYGGQEGSKRDIENVENQPPLQLVYMTINYSDSVVAALQFCYEIVNEKRVTTDTWGKPCSQICPKTNKKKINFDKGERVTEVSGTIADYNGYKVVTSLKIKTNRRTDPIGPFGGETGTPFSMKTTGRIVAFYGRSGDVLDALGCYFYSDSP